MDVELKGTIKLRKDDIEEAIKDYVLKKTGYEVSDWSARIEHNYDQFDRGPGIPFLSYINVDITFTDPNKR